MTDVVYESRVRIERLGGPVRLAHLPGETEPVTFGVHGAIAEHYGVDMSKFEPHATTIDYVVAAAAGWLLGTFAGALAARRIALQKGDLTAEAVGDVEKDGEVLVLKRIRVGYRLRGGAAERQQVERAHAAHQGSCPVARSLAGAIHITTALEYVD